MELLFLAHRVPFPPDRGDKIRSFHLLHALARIGRVHVATFGESTADMAQEAQLASLAASHCLVRRDKPLARAGIEALARRRPVSLAAFDNTRLRAWIAQLLASRPIEAIVVFSGQMGQYVPADYRGRVIVDLCDVDSAKFEAYAEEAGWPRAPLYRREARRLSREEARLVARADTTLLVSEAEAALLRARVGDAEAPIRALRNGIDAQLFDPARVEPLADLAQAPGPQIVFTGQMDYPPNIAAAERAIERILPGIRRTHPDATLHIVGRAAPPRLSRRNGRDGVRVWGEVPDVKPFVAAADLVVAPLTLARGVQNKVLEAMAMARPVLLSPEAATGIDARDGEHFAVAADDRAMVARALSLLGDPARAAAMGRAARHYVATHQSWPAMLAPLEGIVTGRDETRDAA